VGSIAGLLLLAAVIAGMSADSTAKANQLAVCLRCGHFSAGVLFQMSCSIVSPAAL
jgi:hypothetical protein